MTFFIKELCSNCDQIRSFLRIWSHLLLKSLMKNSVFLCSELKIVHENRMKSSSITICSYSVAGQDIENQIQIELIIQECDELEEISENYVKYATRIFNFFFMFSPDLMIKDSMNLPVKRNKLENMQCLKLLVGFYGTSKPYKYLIESENSNQFS